MPTLNPTTTFARPSKEDLALAVKEAEKLSKVFQEAKRDYDAAEKKVQELQADAVARPWLEAKQPDDGRKFSSETPRPVKLDDPKPRVVGVVSDKNANIPNQVVTLNRTTGEQVASVISDGSGKFSFGGLAPDTYVVNVERNGYKKFAYTVSVSVDDEAKADAKLEAETL